MTYLAASPRSLRTALVSTCALPTPPRCCGGIELIVAELAREIQKLGHRPTVFATTAQLHAADPGTPKAMINVRGNDRRFASLARTVSTNLRLSSTDHRDSDSTCVGARAAFFESAAWTPDRPAETRYASAGWAQIAHANDSDVAHVHVAEAIPFTSLKTVWWSGEIDHERQVRWLSRSRCLLSPIRWEEPFGLVTFVTFEAMLFGTPVIAFARGAAPEVVDDGVTGLWVYDLDEMCRRVRDVASLDRAAWRGRARQRWSAARMARECAAPYLEAIDPFSASSSRRTLLHGGDDGPVTASPR